MSRKARIHNLIKAMFHLHPLFSRRVFRTLRYVRKLHKSANL